MNWGTKIALLYSGFVLLVVSMVTLSMRQKVDLVAKDYYRQELEYQQRIDQSNRASGPGEQVQWEVGENNLSLQFPKGATVKGSAYFYRPSDAAGDRTVELGVDTSGLFTIPFAGMGSGMYRLQVKWERNGKAYFREGVIQLP